MLRCCAGCCTSLMFFFAFFALEGGRFQVLFRALFFLACGFTGAGRRVLSARSVLSTLKALT